MTRTRPLLVMACVAGLTVLASAGSLPAVARGQPSEVGTVETIAGPGFCRGQATLDPTSGEVRAVALSGGLLHLDTGPAGEGLFAIVDTQGVRPGGELGTLDPRELVRLEELGPSQDSTPPREGAAEGGVAPAGMLAADGEAGVLVVDGQTIVDDVGDVVAGNPKASAPGTSDGDGGPAAGGSFRSIRAIATDRRQDAPEPVANVYVIDEINEEGNLAIRFVNRTSSPVTFYPGTPQELTVAPGAIDTVVEEVPDPTGGGSFVAMAATGERMYLALSGPSAGGVFETRVHLANLGGRALAAHGVPVAPGGIETVAGASAASSPDSRGPASAPGLGRVPAMTADPQGNLYLVDETNHRVVRLDPEGLVTTVAGTGEAGFNGNERPAAEATLDSPSDMELSAGEQRIYLVDRGNTQLRFIDAAGIIHAGLGNGTGMTWRCPDGDAAPRAEFESLAGLAHLAPDGLGDVYLSLRTYNQVQRLDPSAGLHPVIGVMPAGQVCGEDPQCSPIGDGGPAGEALVNAGDVAVHPGGGLYVVDAGHGVRLANLGADPLVAHGVTVAPGTIETLVSGGDGSTGEPTSASLELSFSLGLAADTRGNLYISDPGEDAPGEEPGEEDEEGGIDPGLYVLGPEGGITTLAGPSVDPVTACCASPQQLTLDGNGNLYVVDDRVWFFNRGTETVVAHGQTVAAGGVAPVSGAEGDLVAGEGLSAQEVGPGGGIAVAADAQGNLYLGSDNEVRRIDPAGILTTVVGTGADGFNGDGLIGRLTTLYGVSDLAVDRCGNVLIADTRNERVRRWNTVGPCAAPSVTGTGTSGGLSGSSQRLIVVGATLSGAGLVALAWWLLRLRSR